MNIINFKNITVMYEENTVLENLTLQVKDGENWAILGANGSGKSTLMKVIQSEIHPVFDKNSTKEILGKSRYSIFELRDKLGIITNDIHNYLFEKVPFLTAYEIVLSGYFSTFGTFDTQEFTQAHHDKILETLKFLEIEHLREKKVQTMSTGELRKCIIARALIHNPQALILDEPTVGLDIKAQVNFIDMLNKMSKNSSIILVTHHLEEIFDGITHVALLSDKTIYKSGKKEDVLTSANLSKVFDIEMTINQHNGRYFIEKV